MHISSLLFETMHRIASLWSVVITSRSLLSDDYHTDEGLKVSFTTVFGYISTHYRVELRSRRGERINMRHSLIVGAVKQKMNDYLSICGQLEFAEMKAGCAPVNFPVLNTLTGNLSLIAN